MRAAAAGYAWAQRPWTKKVARAPAAVRSSRIRSIVPGGQPGRSGCSASNVSATRVRSLTCRHLRRVDVAARGSAGQDREPPGEELDGDDRGGRGEEPIECADVGRRDAI